MCSTYTSWRTLCRPWNLWKMQQLHQHSWVLVQNAIIFCSELATASQVRKIIIWTEWKGKSENDEVPQPISCMWVKTAVSCFAGPVSLLALWTNRITQANSRKHQEFAGRLSSVNNKAELYQHLKEENGCVDCIFFFPSISQILFTHCVFFIRMDVHENGKATRWCMENASSHHCRIIDLLRGCDVTFGMISNDAFARMLILCQT